MPLMLTEVQRGRMSDHATTCAVGRQVRQDMGTLSAQGRQSQPGAEADIAVVDLGAS